MRRGNAAHSIVPGLPGGELSLDVVASLREREERDRTGLFVAEGARFLITALDSGVDLLGAIVCPQWISPEMRAGLLRRLKQESIPCRFVHGDEFRRISQAADPSGILLVARQRWSALPDSVSPQDVWLGIEHLRTPGNVGTLMRSCAATGARGVLVFGPARDRTDVFDPVAVRASMGALFGLSIVATSHAEFRRWRYRTDFLVLGADGEVATDYRSVSYRRPVVFMLGNERTGLSDAQRATCDAWVRIPMIGRVDSLNVAMAGTVLLYEAYGQRHPAKHGRR